MNFFRHLIYYSDENNNKYLREYVEDKTKCKSYDLFDKYGIDNCQILLIEKVNATCKEELLSREAIIRRYLFGQKFLFKIEYDLDVLKMKSQNRLTKISIRNYV